MGRIRFNKTENLGDMLPTYVVTVDHVPVGHVGKHSRLEPPDARPGAQRLRSTWQAIDPNGWESTQYLRTLEEGISILVRRAERSKR